MTKSSYKDGLHGSHGTDAVVEWGPRSSTGDQHEAFGSRFIMRQEVQDVLMINDEGIAVQHRLHSSEKLAGPPLGGPRRDSRFASGRYRAREAQ